MAQKKSAPTAVNMEDEVAKEPELTAEQRMAQMEQETLRKCEEMLAKAAARMEEADKVLEDAKKKAAGIPAMVVPTNPEHEMREAARLPIADRQRRQFGDDVEIIRMAIPYAEDGSAGVMSVTLNGWSYDLQRGEFYDLAKPLVEIVQRSVSIEPLPQNIVKF